MSDQNGFHYSWDDGEMQEKITIHIKDASYKPSWKKDNDEWIEIVIKPK